MKLGIFVTAGALIALALSGCGGSSDTLTKAELIAQADAICKKASTQLDAVPSPESLADLSAAFEKMMAIIEPTMEQLKNLDPPSELQSDYEEWLKMMDARLASVEEVQKVAKTGTTAEVAKAVEGMEDETKGADELAKKIGFKECGDT